MQYLQFIKNIFSKKSNEQQTPVNQIQTTIKNNRILIISDIHYSFSEKEMQILNESFDQCWLLGDIPLNDLKLITDKIQCRIYGVLGNHDTETMFQKFNIENIDCKTTNNENITIVGISGSSKYKENSPYVMYSQEEQLKRIEQLNKADVLISHDSPYRIHSASVNKEGFQGITEYIKKNEPSLHIYGHHHKFQFYCLDKTLCICNYRLGIIEKDGIYHII